MFMALDKMPAAGDYGTLLAQFLPLVVLIVVFYFVLIRPIQQDTLLCRREALTSLRPLLPSEPQRSR